MSTQTALLDEIKDDEFYSNYTKFELDDFISKEAYNAKYNDPSQESEIISPGFLNKVFDKPQDKFIALEKWEGVVTKTNGNNFWADLYSDQANNVEEAMFSYDDISVQDYDLLKVGAIFYWSIGYFDKISGQRLKSSIIKFRRLPTWSKQDIENAQKKAGDLIKNLKVE